MPGSIIFKPIEATLTHNTDWVTKMNPYCVFIVNNQRFNSSTCKHGGKNPHWSDSVIVPMPETETKIKVEIMDKDRFTKDDQIGSFEVNLSELQDLGQSGKRFDLLYKNKSAGELLLEVSFRDEDPNLVHSELIQKEEAIIQEPTVFKKQEDTVVEEKPVVEEEAVKTSVEPHTVMQEADVVEMRPVEQTIEVMEAQKVIKDIQYIEIVPVKKMIETVEHQVVKKEVEIMEPQVVVKTIQVVENVLVKKEVEVIEAVPVLKEVEILEPQTFTKQVEVTEQVPVMKTVTITEPVHVKKPVELSESVIATQSIIKEIHPVNEEELSQKFSQMTLSEEEKARYLAMSEEEKGKLGEEESLRWHEARRLAAASDKAE